MVESQEGKVEFIVLHSVADPGCLPIPDPDFCPSRIQKQQQKRGVKNICCPTFFCSHKYHKVEIILFLNL
jgi:hypothetical protein